jgi:hypothetical protein
VGSSRVPVSTTLGLEVPILAALPRLHNSPLAKCGWKKFCMDFHGDHTSTCTTHSGDFDRCNQVARLDGECARAVVPHGLTRRAHTARSHGNRRPTEWQCGDPHYLWYQAGSRNLDFDLSIAHDRFGSSSHMQQIRPWVWARCSSVARESACKDPRPGRALSRRSVCAVRGSFPRLRGRHAHRP